MAYITGTDSEPNPAGVIVCKLDQHMRGARLQRGYIAMLSVDPCRRGCGIGAQLIQRAVDEMVQLGAAEIVLETEVDNIAALRLYERLGFLREKRKDSFRLSLPIPEAEIKHVVLPPQLPQRRLQQQDSIL